MLLGGSGQIKTAYLGRLAEEPRLASFCLTEPDAGSDVSGMRTTAVLKGDKYVLNGSKCFITNGGYADRYTVHAKTDKDAGHRGISAFLVLTVAVREGRCAYGRLRVKGDRGPLEGRGGRATAAGAGRISRGRFKGLMRERSASLGDRAAQQ